MRLLPAPRWTVAVILTGVVSLAGCGSSGSKSPSRSVAPPASTTTAPAATTTTTMDLAASTAAIQTNWTRFFDGSNKDLNAKLALLENADKIGPAYEQAEAKSGAVATQTTTKVDGVQLLGASDCNDALTETVPCAKVTYDLLVNGKPALAGQIGYAVYVGNTWKVSEVTDCALSALGGVTCPS